MICRDILETKTIGNFDFFNDFNDTHNYLLREAQCHEDPVVRHDARELAIELERLKNDYSDQHWRALADNRKAMKAHFIHLLAKYMVGNQASKSILLQMGNLQAQEWANMRNSTPLRGYPTVEEAEAELTKFLS